MEEFLMISAVFISLLLLFLFVDESLEIFNFSIIVSHSVLVSEQALLCYVTFAVDKTADLV